MLHFANIETNLTENYSTILFWYNRLSVCLEQIVVHRFDQYPKNHVTFCTFNVIFKFLRQFVPGAYIIYRKSVDDF